MVYCLWAYAMIYVFYINFNNNLRTLDLIDIYLCKLNEQITMLLIYKMRILKYTFIYYLYD